MRVIVIGAGIIGTCTAWRLAQQGMQVTLLEAGLPGDGTTGPSFAWVNATWKQPLAYFALNVAGMMAHRRLLAEWPQGRWFVPTGNLEWETTPEAQQRLVAHSEVLRDAGYSVTLLSPRQVVSTLEPDLLIEPGVEAVAFYPDEGYIYPRALLTTLLRRASHEYGVELLTGAKVVDIELRGSRASGVVLADGRHISADAIICCCGRWTNDILSHVGVELPMVAPEEPGSPAVGLLALSSQICAEVRRVIHAPGINIRPNGPSRLLLHSDEQDRLVKFQTPFSPPSEVAEELLRRARAIVRNMDTAHVESATLCIRPMLRDGVPAVGWVPGVEQLYVMVTHSGVTLGPALAEMATREITGKSEPLLTPFRPSRFRSDGGGA